MLMQWYQKGDAAATLRDVAVEGENSGQTIKIEEPVPDLVNAWIQGKWG